MLERTDAIKNGVLEPITYFQAIRAKLSVTETNLRSTALFGLPDVKGFISIVFMRL